MTMTACLSGEQQDRRLTDSQDVSCYSTGGSHVSPLDAREHHVLPERDSTSPSHRTKDHEILATRHSQHSTPPTFSLLFLTSTWYVTTLFIICFSTLPVLSGP